jgi:hypothetical protein
MLIHPHIISVHKTRVTLALRITSNPAKKISRVDPIYVSLADLPHEQILDRES